MPTEILRPNASGFECTIPDETGCSACNDHFDCVDEAVADDDTTLVKFQLFAGTESYRDLYNIPASGVGEGTINKITVTIRCSTIFLSGVGKCSIRIGGTTYDGAGQNITGAWNTKTEDWVQNPDSVAPWTWEDIGNLEIGIWLEGTHIGKIGTVSCTQVFVTIEYTTGWTGKIAGVTDPAKIMGVAVADIESVKGVA